MSEAVALKPYFGFGRYITVSASRQGNEFGRDRLVDSGMPITYHRDDAASIESRLSGRLTKAKEFVRYSVRDLGADHAQKIASRLSYLFDSGDWDEADELPKVSSVQTMVKTIIALGLPTGSLTLTRTGHLVGTWHDANGSLRIEGLPDGNVTWARIRKEGDQTRAYHHAFDSIGNLRAELNS